jgi:simple sugar transport system permease protein
MSLKIFSQTKTKKFLDGLTTNGVGIGIALIINSLFIVAAGGGILFAYKSMWAASFGSMIGFGQMLNKLTPLLFGALAVAVGTKGGVYNIGVDGQIYLGAVFATGIGFMLADLPIPGPLMILIVLLAGAIGGGLFAGIAGFLRAVYNVNEIFTTVMLNFLATFLVDYLSTGPWNDPIAGEAITMPIPSTSQLPYLIPGTGSHVGILISLLAVVAVWFLINKTKLGYHIRAVGDNAIAARVGGINVKLTMFYAMFISGAIAGIAGAVEVIGVHSGRLILGLTPGYGTFAILIAAVGLANPISILPWSIFFAIFFVGTDSLQRSISFPASGVLVFQALMFLIIMYIRILRGQRTMFTSKDEL